MGWASKTLSVCLRVGELISASIVAGLVGSYLHYVNDAGDSESSRMVYTVAIAGISIFFSLVLMPPLKYSFWAFALDFALFVCWMVAFGLLEDLTGSGGCNSAWYWQRWGYYWGGYYVYPYNTLTQSIVGTSACSKWRATLAWSFIGGMCWLVSFILGMYVIYNSRTESLNRNAEMAERMDINDGTEGIHTKAGQNGTNGAGTV